MKTKGSVKYIGLVKWFHDHLRDSDYGFIQHPILGELYFNQRSIDQGEDIKLFNENVAVVFSVKKESNNHIGKPVAIEVKVLDSENDLNFLLSHFLSVFSEKRNYLDYNIIQQEVYSRMVSLLEVSSGKQVINNLFDIFKNYLRENEQTQLIDDEIYLKSVLKFGKSFFSHEIGKISEIIEKQISVEMAHKLWLDDFLETCQWKYIADIFLSESKKVQYEIISKCTPSDLDLLFEPLKNNILSGAQSNILTIEQLENILIICRKFYLTKFNIIADLVESAISPELAHHLWLDGLLKTCQIDYVASILLSLSKAEKGNILTKCSEEDKNEVFFKILYEIDKIDTGQKISAVKDVITLSKEYLPNQHFKILNEALKNCPDHVKLILWLEDFHEILDFNIYKLYSITLSTNDQKKFLKKTLKSVHEGKANISVEDFTSLNVIDFKTSKEMELLDNSKLDYSASIILNVISELNSNASLESKKQVNAAQKRIYELILKQIREPTDILEISGFFDECEGRARPANPPDNTIIRDKYKTEKNHPFCDGRKAPILSKENLEFWWCANKQCFKPSRQLHSSKDWEKYSLLDFLTILKIDFKESDLEIYIGLINKTNRFLKHLKCRECDHILYPKGETKFAFDRINFFTCGNENCSEKGNEIYLSHCLNYNCRREIDSRDCVKCKPGLGGMESCGWFICNYCNSCCSSKQLNNRKEIHEKMLHIEYKCHLEGHRDLGILPCNKCGDPMEKVELIIDKYNRLLDWFKSQRGIQHSIVHKSGQNKGRWWFTIKKREGLTYEDYRGILTKILKIGFQVPDIETDKYFQLIHEPINIEKRKEEILTCTSCGHFLDLTIDLEKASAIKNFHFVKFPVEPA